MPVVPPDRAHLINISQSGTISAVRDRSVPGLGTRLNVAAKVRIRPCLMTGEDWEVRERQEALP